MNTSATGSRTLRLAQHVSYTRGMVRTGPFIPFVVGLGRLSRHLVRVPRLRCSTAFVSSVLSAGNQNCFLTSSPLLIVHSCAAAFRTEPVGGYFGLLLVCLTKNAFC